ncbi:Unknown protein, partial [Striga hermonthica]
IGSNRAQETRAADAAAMPPPPPQNPAAAQPGGAAGQVGAPPQAAVQVPGQQVVMTRQEMQQMVAEAAAQAVQQFTNSLSRATAMQNTVAGSRQNAEEDESSYGGGGPPHDREMERMAEQLRRLQARVDGRAERRARGHPSLRAGPCRTSLAKTPARTYDEVLRRCRKYINLEETETEFAKLEELGRGESRKEKAVSPKRRASPRREGRAKQDRGREDRWKDMPISGGKRYHDYTPLNAKVAKVLMAMEKGIDGKDVTWPRSRFEGPTPPKSRRYCRFHKDYGHTTKDCRHLKDEIERLIRAGHLEEFVYQDKVRRKEKRRCREDSVEKSEEDDEEARGGRDGRKRDEGKKRRGSREREREGDGGQVKRGMIYMISGGPTDGDSNNARRGHVRAMKRKREEVSITARVPEISFQAEDAAGVVIPHNDALVITTEVAGFDVKRVFIETGSLVDVMFYDFF